MMLKINPHERISVIKILKLKLFADLKSPNVLSPMNFSKKCNMKNKPIVVSFEKL